MATNNAQLIEMERMLRSAPEPGGMSIGPLGEGSEVSITKTTVTSAGYVTLWNTDTHESAVMNMNSVRGKLSELFPADHPRRAMLPAWTVHEPKEKPWCGHVTCPLHVDRPERAAYDLQGYPTCTMNVLPNEMEAKEHLKKKHPQTYRQINAAKDELERLAATEDRIINRRILAKLAGVDLDEPAVVETPVVIPSVWDTGGSTTSDIPENTTVTVMDVNTTFTMPDAHPHRFTKALGAKCKVTGCSVVRKIQYKARK